MDEKTLIEDFRLELVALVGRYLAKADDLQGYGRTNLMLRKRLRCAYEATELAVCWRDDK